MRDTTRAGAPGSATARPRAGDPRHPAGPAAARAPVTLGEGNTPLLPSRWIGPQLGLRGLWFKLEQTNPTGSYKDRFAARFVTLLLDRPRPFCLATSSGNTGAALAAYAAAGGVPCVVCVPAEAPATKLSQIRAYGARVLRVRGMVDSTDALRAVLERLRTVSAECGMPLGTSAYAVAPEAMAAIEPLSGELTAALGAPPDRVFAPVGGGGLLSAVWRGFATQGPSVAHRGAAARGRPRPRIHAVQPSRNDTLVSALRAGEETARTLGPGRAPTGISGLAVPLDLDATTALRAVRASGGDGHLVEDGRVREVQGLLAAREGLFVEPAGAAAVAGLWQAARSGAVGADEQVVCLLTGHGLKDAADSRGARAHPEEDVVTPDDLRAELLERVLGPDPGRR